MKIKNLFLLLFIGAMFGVSSCKKTDEKPENAAILTQQAFFNDLGIQHNKILTFVGKNIDVSRTKAEDRFNFTSDFMNSYGFTWKDAQESFKITNQILADPQNARVYLLNKRNNSELSTYYDSLALVMDYCLVSISDSNNIIKPEQYNQMIARLEHQIYVNFDVVIDTITGEGNEAALFLSACAISRHSYQFWYDAATDPTNPWYDFINNNDNRFLGGLWHAIKVAAADTWGALTSGWSVQNDMPPITWNIHDAWAGGSKASSSVD